MKYTNLRAFEKHLEGAAPLHFADIYMLLSKNSYDLKTATNSILDFVLSDQPQRNLALKVLQGDNVQLQALQQELQAISFFCKKQAIVIYDADKLKKNCIEALEHYFASPNRSKCLILSATAINRSTNFFKKAEKAGVVLDVPEEKPWEKEKSIVGWLATKTASMGKKISPQACQALAKQAGTDQTLLEQELEKLLCYIDSRDEITVQDIGAICASVNIETIWQLGEAIFRHDASTAIRIINALLDDGTHLLALLKQIRHQFQTHFQVCCIIHNGGGTNEVSQAYPYMRGAILDRNMQMAKGYGMQRYKQGLINIDATESKAKNSAADLHLLAELLVVKLCSK